MCLTCNQKLVQQTYPDLAHKALVKIVVAKCSEIEIKETSTFMKHVNKPVIVAAPTIRLRMTKNTELLRRQTLS